MAKCAGVVTDCAVKDTIEFVWNVVAELVNRFLPVSLEPTGSFVSVPLSVTALSVLHAPRVNS